MPDNCGNLNTHPCDSSLCQENLYFTMQRVNKRVKQSSSQLLHSRQSLDVTRWLAHGENTTNLNSMNAGGSGDLVTSKEVSNRNGVRGNKSRTNLQYKTGVDKKHGSYSRYLSRRVGKVLRQEKSANVVKRTAIIGGKSTKTKIPPPPAIPFSLWSNTCCDVQSATIKNGRLPKN